jgi:hypothetical protein
MLAPREAFSFDAAKGQNYAIQPNIDVSLFEKALFDAILV